MAEPRNSEAADRRAAALLGRVISERYRIDEILAMGGMGAVYRGEHVRMRKRVAIKVLHPETENLPELAARFEREAIAGAHLEHPNVAAATDFGRLDDGSYFLVLEYVRGITLSELIKAGPLPPARAVSIARQIASALAAAHRLGIVHRDVKPRNVMLAQPALEKDQVKLIDFGLAKVPLERISTVPQGEELEEAKFQTAVGVVFGTIAYMAPETALGMDAVDHRSDLYALGIILYEMLAGAHPFDAIDPGALFLQQRTAPPPPIHERGPGVYVPRDLEALVMRLLNKSQDSRFQSAESLIAALDAASGGLEAAGTLPPPPEGAHISVAGAVPTSIPPPSPGGPAAVVPVEPRRPPKPAAGSPPRPPPPPPPRRPVAEPRPEPKGKGHTQLLETPPPPPGYVPGAVGRGASTRPRGRRPMAGLLVLVAIAAALAATWFLRPRTPASARAKAERGLAEIAERGPPDITRRQDGLTAAEWRDRLTSAAQSKQWSRAAAAIAALAELEPKAFHEKEVASAAAATAASLDFVGGPDADATFTILSMRLGADGLDVLYEIVATRGGSKGANHALEILKKPEVLSRATPALRITVELREAPCKDKPALFDRAAEEGDIRALGALDILHGPGCKPRIGQCCFQKNAELEKAVSALRSRLRR